MPSSSAAPAVMEREKRSTAGKRMTALVGKAQEDDDAFWNHDTWAEEDSGNDSFRESDEDSALRKDVFDSDFNDSETDSDDDGDGEDADRQLLLEERKQKRSATYDISKGGRAMLQRAKGTKGSKRAVGAGINAGIVLNFPAPSDAPTTPMDTTASSSSLPPVQTQTQTPSTSSPSRARSHAASVSVRERRSQTRKRDTRNSTPTYSDTAQTAQKRIKPQSSSKKAKRRHYQQEELLIEAVHQTEPENYRWLLARKRVQETADQESNALAALRDKHRSKNVIQKYHSRRGCLITLTFPEMDSLPELLKRPREQPTKPESIVCVVTGKPAKYRDPLTGKGYSDVASFKELRRRHAAGEPLDPQNHNEVKSAENVANDAVPAVAASSTVLQAAAPATTTAASIPSKPASAPPVTPSKPKDSTTDATDALTPTTSKFVVDLAGTQQKSPGSTRSSSRKWKPSEKMLHGLVHSPKKSETPASSTAMASAPPMPVISSSQSSQAKAAVQTAAMVVDKENPTPTTNSAPSNTSQPPSTATAKKTSKKAATNGDSKPKAVKKAARTKASLQAKGTAATKGQKAATAKAQDPVSARSEGAKEIKVEPDTQTTNSTPTNTTSVAPSTPASETPTVSISSTQPPAASSSKSVDSVKEPTVSMGTETNAAVSQSQTATASAPTKGGGEAAQSRPKSPKKAATKPPKPAPSKPADGVTSSSVVAASKQEAANSTPAAETVSTGTVAPVAEKVVPPTNEQIFILPADGDNNSKSEPRYITQSELIMQAITNYKSKRLEETPPDES